MSLIHYHVDLSSLDMQERKHIFDLIDKFAFTGPDFVPGLSVIEFTLDEKENLDTIVKIPASCQVVASGSSSRSK